MTSLTKQLCTCGHDRSDHQLIGANELCNVSPCGCMAFEALTSNLMSQSDLEAIKKRAHSVWVRSQVCNPMLTQDEADIANLLRHIDALMELPPSLRDPIKVMERGRELLKEWEASGDSPSAQKRHQCHCTEPCGPNGQCAYETSRELERLRELQEKALALDDAVAEFGIDKPQYIAEVYQAFHDVLHDGHGSPSVVKTLVEVRAFGTSIDPPSQKASACECVQYCAIYNKGTPGCRNLPLHPRDAQGKESKP